jgi:VanZ family protein
MIGLIGAAAVMSIVALMLSDRAPGVLQSVFGDAVQRLSARIDASERLPSTERLPESDFLVHVGLWAVAAVLVGWTIWSWRGLVLGALTVLTISLLVEAAQGTYSETRAVELSDVAANAVGVGLGTTVAAACYLVWSLFGSLVDRMRPAR